MNTGFLWLFAAILSEIFSTSFLRSTEGFTRLLPTIMVLTGYGISFYCLSHTVKLIPTGIAYAIWSGVGIVCVSLIARFFFNQKFDAPAIIGMILIVAGVLVIQLFSKTATH